jgi:hypothetical protein
VGLLLLLLLLFFLLPLTHVSKIYVLLTATRALALFTALRRCQAAAAGACTL